MKFYKIVNNVWTETTYVPAKRHIILYNDYLIPFGIGLY